MFPLKNTEAYIHANGYRSTLGKELAARDAEISELGSEIQALTNYVTDTGVKNLLPVSLSALKSLNAGGSWNGNACTIGGITFTVNDDLSITLNGTSTATATFILYSGTNPTDYNGKILSGFTGGSGGTGIRISDAIVTSVYNYSDDTLITGLTATNQVAVIIRIDSGKTFNNQLVTPMIRDASIADGSYQPYAKTNVELTQNVAGLTAKSFTKITNSEYANEVLFAKSGTSKIVQISAPKGIAANTNVEIAIPSGYTSEVATATGSLASFTSDFVISGGKIRMSINNAGNLELRSSIAITSAIDEVLYMPYV